LHGGAFIVRLLPIYDDVMREYTKRSGVPMLLVDYRVAPEHPHPTPVDDCYTALCWLANNAGELGVDPKRIAVMGESAGGGLAAGVALMARDRDGPALAQQLLIYAMLDDRTIGPDPHLPSEYLVFSYDDNRTGWGALLGAAWHGDGVSPYAAPARATDLSGLPETYVDVGDLDILRDENIEYARRLMAAGIPTELHVVPGLPHGFEMAAPDAAATQRVMASRLGRLKRL
jgi:acetyl esterase/lipase